jgi:hypothetical protein
MLFSYAYQAPADAVKHLYLQYAKLEEDYGLPKRAMMIYDKATKVPNNKKACMKFTLLKQHNYLVSKKQGKYMSKR